MSSRKRTADDPRGRRVDPGGLGNESGLRETHPAATVVGTLTRISQKGRSSMRSDQQYRIASPVEEDRATLHSNLMNDALEQSSARVAPYASRLAILDRLDSLTVQLALVCVVVSMLAPPRAWLAGAGLMFLGFAGSVVAYAFVESRIERLQDTNNAVRSAVRARGIGNLPALVASDVANDYYGSDVQAYLDHAGLSEEERHAVEVLSHDGFAGTLDELLAAVRLLNS